MNPVNIAVTENRRERWWEWPRFRLVPHFWFRPADRWNTCDWGLSWLFLRVWTGIGFEFSLKVELNDQNAGVQIHVPWLHIRLEVPLFPYRFYQKLWRTRRGSEVEP